MGSSNRQRRIIQPSGKLPKWPGKDELDRLDKQYWTIIGNGSIGAKAEELRNKTWPALASGFTTHRRFVLAMELMKAFRVRNNLQNGMFDGLEDYKIDAMKKTFEFSPEEIEIARKILQALPKTPLVVRSSAHADCLGTGIYDSDFISNNLSEKDNLKQLLVAIRNVLASEFYPDGIAFRRNMGIPEGMAVIIEPVFGVKNRSRPEYEEYDKDGKEVYEEFFAPFYGGIGYTSTSYSGPLIGVGAGIPTKVMETGGIEMIEGDTRRLIDLFGNPENVHGFLRKDERAICGSSSDQTFEDLTKTHGISLASGYVEEIYSPETFPIFEREKLDWLFSKLRILEQLIGKPQRIEWAAIDKQLEKRTFFNGFDGVPGINDFFRAEQERQPKSKPNVCMLQIGEVNPKQEFYHFSDSERTIMRSRYVKGTGIRECNGLVWIRTESELGLLRKYNAENKEHITMYPEGMTRVKRKILSFHNLSNSSLVVEMMEQNALLHGHHDNTPLSHFGGALEANNILFMVVTDGSLDDMWDKIIGRRKIIKGSGDSKLWVFEGKFRVTMSDAQKRAVVEIIY